MLKLEKFTGDKTYMFPDNSIATPERITAEYPAVTVFPHVLEVNGDVCQAIMNLNALRQMHSIDAALTEDEAIAAIETIVNTPPPSPEPSTEERMVAAMEFQNLMSL